MCKNLGRVLLIVLDSFGWSNCRSAHMDLNQLQFSGFWIPLTQCFYTNYPCCHFDYVLSFYSSLLSLFTLEHLCQAVRFDVCHLKSFIYGWEQLCILELLLMTSVQTSMLFFALLPELFFKHGYNFWIRIVQMMRVNRSIGIGVIFL